MKRYAKESMREDCRSKQVIESLDKMIPHVSGVCRLIVPVHQRNTCHVLCLAASSLGPCLW